MNLLNLSSRYETVSDENLGNWVKISIYHQPKDGMRPMHLNDFK